jgi:hypothetical protein
MKRLFLLGLFVRTSCESFDYLRGLLGQPQFSQPKSGVSVSAPRCFVMIVFRSAIEPPWTEIEPIRVGRVPKSLGTPDAYVTAELGDRNRIRVDIYADSSVESFSFEQAQIWNGWLVLGFGNKIYLISSAHHRAVTVDLGAYFGHLYPAGDLLLVAGDRKLWCLDRDGIIKWVSPVVGIDGVVVNGIKDGVISGEGEWDPPGGWKPFRLNLESGELR